MKKVPSSLLHLIFQAVLEALIPNDQEEDIEVDALLLVIFQFILRKHPEREVADHYIRAITQIVEEE